ncbi:MAG: hypothetical protein EAZ89_19140 [Bacteroidetes bacterium]|jgi:hypothetical protein|nr:MAG: hypothetical protein EAZ89_19140 [Bacteroidota bacterium]
MQNKKTKLAPFDYAIILVIFAITGTTAAIIPRWIMPVTGLTPGTWQYVVAYILLITPVYQVLLLGYAFIFGKFQYFYEKQKQLFRWLTGRRKKPADDA